MGGSDTLAPTWAIGGDASRGLRSADSGRLFRTITELCQRGYHLFVCRDVLGRRGTLGDRLIERRQHRLVLGRQLVARANGLAVLEGMVVSAGHFCLLY